MFTSGETVFKSMEAYPKQKKNISSLFLSQSAIYESTEGFFSSPPKLCFCYGGREINVNESWEGGAPRRAVCPTHTTFYNSELCFVVSPLRQLPAPTLFEIKAVDTKKILHCGVLEFSASEKAAFIPEWVRGRSIMLAEVLRCFWECVRTVRRREGARSSVYFMCGLARVCLCVRGGSLWKIGNSCSVTWVCVLYNMAGRPFFSSST